MRPPIKNYLVFFLFTAGAVCIQTNTRAQCSVANPAGCSCPTPGQTNCMLLPDITAGKRTLNSTAGWAEYNQAAAAPNKGLLRLDVSTPNIGWGPVETIPTNNYLCGTDTLFNFVPPSGFLCPDGSYPKRLIKQRVYQKAGNSIQFNDRDAGWMIYHPSHGHIHIEGWGLYTLRLADASIADTLQWPVVNSGVKVSFCLIDLTTCSGALGDCKDANGNTLTNSSFPNYGLGGGYGCNNVKQGISVGKVDIYGRHLDESFVKIPYEACNGSYYVMIQVDPDNHFLEMRDDNNWLAAQIPITKQRTSNTGAYAYLFSKKGNTICQGTSMDLEASGASNYVWSNGATTQKISVNAPGRYWVRATTPCGTTTSDTLDIFQSGPSAYPAVTTEDTLCAGERATLYASGNAHWYDAPSGGNLVFIGNSFETGSLFNNTTYYVADQPSVLSGNMGPATTGFSGAGNYTGTRSDYLIFNAFLPFKLKRVRVDAQTAGIYTIQLRDQYGHLLKEQNFPLLAGQQDIVLNFFVPAGLNHQLGLSSSSPQAALYSSTTASTNIGFPYKVKSVANIVGSSSGDARYPFFYNWEVEALAEACNNGQRKAVTATVVPAPAVSISGLAAEYSHAADAVTLTATPPGGTFSGNGITNNQFHPRLAGIGTHIITYTYSNGYCTAQDAKQTFVKLDNSLLRDDFSVQLWDHPGQRPFLWVVSNELSPVEISLFTATGQLLQRMEKTVYPGGNYVLLDLNGYPKGLYIINVRLVVNGKMKSIKMIK